MYVFLHTCSIAFSDAVQTHRVTRDPLLGFGFVAAPSKTTSASIHFHSSLLDTLTVVLHRYVVVFCQDCPSGAFPKVPLHDRSTSNAVSVGAKSKFCSPVATTVTANPSASAPMETFSNSDKAHLSPTSCQSSGGRAPWSRSNACSFGPSEI
jgi:hypothetical protein